MDINQIMRWIVTYALYPILIFTVFAFIIMAIYALLAKTQFSTRVIIASVLPVAVLVFLIVSDHEESASLAAFLSNLAPVVRFAVGAGLGIALIEIGKRVFSRDSELGSALYALWLSTFGVFMFYCLIAGLLQSIHVFLFGLVLGGGLYAIFRGFPEQ